MQGSFPVLCVPAWVSGVTKVQQCVAQFLDPHRPIAQVAAREWRPSPQAIGYLLSA